MKTTPFASILLLFYYFTKDNLHKTIGLHTVNIADYRTKCFEKVSFFNFDIEFY